MNADETAAGAGLGASQRALVQVLKTRGAAAVPELAGAVGLNVETVRHHVQQLMALGVVERQGTRRAGPGRPEVVYVLAGAADALFPRREGEVLRALARHLKETGQERVLESFFESYIGARRAEAHARVSGLDGEARLQEVARILTELGFMAELEERDGGGRLRLCHCPMRELVEETTIPCRAELGFIRELLGERLARLSYIPAGDRSCTYQAAGAER
jgi:predicted ArsR family transcriptional regulator